MKKILAILFTLNLVASFGQLRNIYHEGNLLLADSTIKDSSQSLKGYAGLEINYFTNSNSFTHDFLGKALGRTGSLESEDLSNQDDHIKPHNRFGYLLDYNFFYAQRLNEKLGVWAEYRDRQFVGGSLPTDGYNLLFKGNKQFEGDTVDLTDIGYLDIHYQALTLGTNFSLRGDVLQFQLGASLIKANGYQALNSALLTLFTAPYGEYIDVQAYGSFEYANTGEFKLKHVHGWGGAIHLGMQGKISDKSSFGFSIRDLGRMALKDINYYEVDTTMRFDGVTSVSLFEDEITFDTVSNPIRKGKRDLGVQLPTRIQISYQNQVSETINLWFGVQHMFMDNYVTQLHVRPTFSVHEKVNLSPLIVVGGFSNFDYGISTEFRTSKKSRLSLDLLYLEPLIARKSSSGAGAYIDYIVLF